MKKSLNVLIYTLLIFSVNLSAQQGFVKSGNAITYFVSPIGSDSNDGLTQGTAFYTIQKASNLTMPGDTVFIMEGTFLFQNTFLSIKRSGSEDQWITYKALGGDKPKIKISGNVWQAVLIEADYIVFEGIELEGDLQNLNFADAVASEEEAQAGGTDWNKYSVFNTAGIVLGGNNSNGNHHFVIRACKIHDFPASGVGSARSDYITIEDNVIYNTNFYTMWPSSAISLYHLSNLDDETGYKNFIRRNICYNSKALVKWISTGALSDGNGIIVDDNRNLQSGALTGPYTGRTLVENNLCYNNGGSGIHAYSSDHVDIINNTTYNNGLVVDYAEIFQNDAADGKVINNIMYAKNGGKVNSNYNAQNITYDYNIYYNGNIEIKGAHDKVTDPFFVNASLDPALANFQLSEGSPAIDYGTMDFAAPADFPVTDIKGNIRPQGTGIDAGAYESAFHSNSNVCHVIAPANGESFKAGSTINITAIAKTESEMITKIEFYQGNTKLGESLSYPYSMVWENVSPGDYTITARVFDENNVPAISEGILVRVSSNESVQKLLNGEFDDKTDNWTLLAWNGATGSFTIDYGTALSGINSALLTMTAKGSNDYEAQFRQSVSIVKGREYSISFSAKADANRSLNVWIQKAGSPYTTFFSKTAGITKTAQTFGPFTFKATVTDNDCALEFLMGIALGSLWIDNISFTEIDKTVKAECNLTSPAKATTFDNPASVEINASVSVTGSTITKVEFYADNVLLGTDKTAPYSYTWYDRKNGDYLLTARAYDAGGNITTSSVNDISILNVTGIEPFGLSPLAIFPNPADRFIYIMNPGTEILEQIEIFNLQGRVLIDIPNFINNSSPIDIRELNAGIYIVKVSSADQVHSYKLVKQ